MNFSGHKKNWEDLKELSEANRLPHALLFCGLSGIGKKAVALHLIQFLFCLSRTKDGPCETCPSCKRVETREHPDLRWIEPEKDVIKIEKIRELKNALVLKPFEAPLKVAVIEEAHLMNAAASNALLKTLEEPPASTLIFLITDSPNRLLKTTLSRCQKIPFSPLSEVEVRQVFEAQGKVLDARLIQWVGGSPGLLASFADEAWEQVDQAILPALETTPKDLTRLLQAAEQIAQEETLHKPVLDLLQFRWKEKIIEDASASNLKKFDAIQMSRRALDRYANPLLTFETLFLNLCL